MRAATHLATAGLTGVIATGFGADLTVASGAALAVGSLLPDIDTQHSGLGRLIKPISGPAGAFDPKPTVLNLFVSLKP